MIYDLIDMNNWKTKPEILKELKEQGIEMQERTFRKTVEITNKMYANHEIDKFIAHGPKGYRVTTSEEDIRASAKDYRKRGLDQLVKSSKILKALGENANMSLQIKDGTLVYTEI